MSVKLAYNRVEQFSNGTGIPYAGAKLFTYVGGSVNTKQTTYVESTGTTPNTNPIVLDSSGQLPQPIWLTTGLSYKFVLAPSTDTDPPTSPIWTLDGVTGVNDSSASQSEWIAGPAPTFVSATQFTLVGDQTTNFAKSRRVKATVTAGTVYGTITNSAFAALTTVTVALDSGNLDSGLSAISYGIVAAVNPSIDADMVNRKGTAVVSAATTDIWSIAGDYVHVTGATGPITSFGTAPYAGAQRTVIFDSTPTINNGASLLIPGAVNLVATANARLIVRADTTTNMVVIDAVGFTQAANTVFAGPPTGAAAVPTFRALVPADLSMTPITNSLSGDVVLNNTANYFDGPSVAQGTAGTWFASGIITCTDTAAAADLYFKLWDGTTVIASGHLVVAGGSQTPSIAVSGYITSPAGNIRISVRDITSVNGLIKFNVTGNSKDSTLSAIRIS